MRLQPARSSFLSALTLVFSTLVACNDGKDTQDSQDTKDSQDTHDSQDTQDTAPTDADGDGSPEGVDCDDEDASVAPGAEETCDSKDNDCDGDVDEEGATGGSVFYADDDGDGFGDANVSAEGCSPPEGYVDDADDCDDANAGVNPGAAEVCDFVDQDCDGVADNGLTYTYADADGDGFGSAAGSPGCATGPGTALSNDDCDDTSATVSPGAPELCDGQQNDCTRSSWTTEDEEGTVSAVDASGAWSDETAAWTAGVDGAPVDIDLPAEGTVYLCDGTYYVSLRDTGGTLSLEARTPGRATLDGGGVARILDVWSGVSLDLVGLNVSNGVADSTGGAISTFGTLVVDGCTFTDNSAPDAGGAIHSDAGSVLQVFDSTFSGNESYLGAAINAYAATVAIEGTTFSDNHATGAGAGVSVHESTLSVVDSVFERNNADVFGGGLHVWGSEASCDGSSGGRYGWFANTAGTGAGIYIEEDGLFTATSCDFGATGSPDDNLDTSGGISDVHLVNTGTSTWEDDASFACGAGACVE